MEGEMSLNLELKDGERRIKDKIDALNLNFDLIEQKVIDAHGRVYNLIHAFERLIREARIEEVAQEMIDKLQDLINRNLDLTQSFIDTGITFSDELKLIIARYKDNTFRLRQIATNGVLNGNPKDYIYSGVKFLDDYTFTTGNPDNNDSSTHLVNDWEDREINGVRTGALNGSNQNLTTGFNSLPGYGRNLFIKMYNTLEVVEEFYRKQQQSFTRESDNVRGLDNSSNFSAPFFVLQRTNKVYSLDFGIQYQTDEKSLDVYIDFKRMPIATANSNTAGNFTKNFYGSLIIKDLDDSIEASYILYNSEKSHLRNDLPEFKFRIAYDEDNLFIFLESVKPHSFTYATNDEELYVRDILEMMVNVDNPMTEDDLILSIKNKWGVKNEIFTSETIRNTLKVLAPFAGDLNAAKNIYVMPKYSVNMSIKDNSFYARDSFIVGNLFNNASTLLQLPHTFVNVKVNSGAQVQLNGVELTLSNNIAVVSDVSMNDAHLNITNTILSSVEGKLVRRKTIGEMVKENNEFIKKNSINGSSVFYHTRVMMATTLNDGLQVDTDKIPDYVIHEFGQYFPAKEDAFSCRYFILYKGVNELVEIDSLESLRQVVSGAFIPFIYDDGVKDGEPIRIVDNGKLSLGQSNLNRNSYTTSLPIFRNLNGLGIDDKTFKGLVRIDTRLLPDFYEIEEIELQHITYAETNDGKSIYGVADKQHVNQEDLTNQVRTKEPTVLVHRILVQGENFDFSYSGNITVSSASDNRYREIHFINHGDSVTYCIEPYEGYIIKSVTVNGVETTLKDGNLIVLKNVVTDIIINVDVIEGEMYTITIVVDGVEPNREDEDSLEEGDYLAYENTTQDLVRQMDEDSVFPVHD